MAAFIEVHTRAGMDELVNVSAIQSVRQMKKCTQLIFIDEEPLEIVQSYQEIKALLRRALAGEVVVSAELTHSR